MSELSSLPIHPFTITNKILSQKHMLSLEHYLSTQGPNMIETFGHVRSQRVFSAFSVCVEILLMSKLSKPLKFLSS